MVLLQSGYIIWCGVRSEKYTFSRFSPSLGQYLPIYQWGRNDGTSDKAEAHRLGAFPLSRQKPVRDMVRVSP